MTATCATNLALAGRSDTLFSDAAATLIHQTSRGYPRAVNNLALQAPAQTGFAAEGLDLVLPAESPGAGRARAPHH